MQSHGNDLALTYAELAQHGISETYLWKAVSVNTGGTAWRTVRLEGTVHVLYASIPPRTRAKLPSEQELRRMLAGRAEAERQSAEADSDQLLAGHLRRAMSTEHARHLGHYLSLGSAPIQAEALAQAAAVWLVAVGIYMQPRTQEVPFGYAGKEAFYAGFLRVLPALGNKYLRTSNARHLKRKLQEIKTKAAELGSLDLAVQAVADVPHRGNQYAAKLNDWHRNAILTYMSSGKNYVAREIYELVAYAAEQNEQKAPSFEAVKDIFERNDFKQLAAPTRLGAKKHENRNEAYGLRIGPLRPGDLWEVDGTRLSFKYRSKDGKVGFLDWLPVIDTFSLAIIGFEVGNHENATMARDAIRMAAKAVGYIPFEILTDNGAAFKAKETAELMDRLTAEVRKLHPEKIAALPKLTDKAGNALPYGIQRRAKPYNARDKRIERCLQTIQNYCGRLYSNYAGEGILSRRDNARPSPEFQAASEVDLPTLDQLKYQIAEAVKFYNHYEAPQRDGTKEMCPWQRLKSVEPAAHTPLDYLKQVMLFADRRTVTVRNQLVTVKIDHTDYHYRLWQTDHITKYNGKKVVVFYDTSDLSTVDVFAFNPHGKTPETQVGEAIDHLKLAKNFHMARANQTEADTTEMAKLKSHKARVATEQEEARATLRRKAEAIAPVDALEKTELIDVRKAVLNDAESELMLRLFTDRHDLRPADRHRPEPVLVGARTEAPAREAKPRHKQKTFYDAGIDGARIRTARPQNEDY